MPPSITIIAAFIAGYGTCWLVDNRWFFRRSGERADISRAIRSDRKKKR